MNNQNIVGILGGMGPEATVELMQRVISTTPAKDDIDHVHMIVDCNPKVPSRIKVLIEENGESPLATMIAMAERLEKAGASYIVIPCNTAHAYHSSIMSSVKIPVWSIIDLTIKHLKSIKPVPVKVGILGSTAILRTGIYNEAMRNADMEPMFPSDEHQTAVLSMIKAVKSGCVSEDAIDQYKLAVNSLLELHCDVLLLACTELSVISDQIPNDEIFVDTLDVLVNEIVRKELLQRSLDKEAVVDLR